jgi:hypothetical protein
MNFIQRAGMFAAFINAAVAIATIYVAVVLIGIDVLSNQDLFVKLAITNPTPIFIQDTLKFISAACGIVLIIVLFRRLRNEAVTMMRVATLFGVLSILFLLTNATLSLIATTQAVELAESKSESAQGINSAVGMLAMATIISSGLWYLLLSLAALKGFRLPKGLNYIGLTIGVISLIPIFGIVALFLSIVWSFWLGLILYQERTEQS